METEKNTNTTDAVVDEQRIEHTEDAIIVHLREPLTYTGSKLEGERTLEALTLPRGVKGKHMVAMDKAEGEMGKTLALIAKLAGIPPHAARELDGRDVDLVTQPILPFLPKLQQTGQS